MRQTCKNVPHFQNRQHLEKCGTIGKMRKPWKNAADFAKCATLGKNVAHLKKMRHP